MPAAKSDPDDGDDLPAAPDPDDGVSDEIDGAANVYRATYVFQQVFTVAQFVLVFAVVVGGHDPHVGRMERILHRAGVLAPAAGRRTA